MINAERILQTLDRHLDHAVRLVIYGRAAIALGFDDPPEMVKHSLDVDAIISGSQAPILRADIDFWDAQDATNLELEKDGLYITHLFEADQLFLRRDWEQHLLPVTRPPLRWLRLFRPATLDLILTKMMRILRQRPRWNSFAEPIGILSMPTCGGRDARRRKRRI